MGCAMTKEKIEAEMLLIQLERIKIRDERNLIINQLEISTGQKYKRKKIPDFIKKNNHKKKNSYIQSKSSKISLQLTKKNSQSMTNEI
jgi:hypothetical protein